MILILTGAALCAIGLLLLFQQERDFRAHRRWCAKAAKAEGAVARIGRRNWHSRNEPTSDDSYQTVPVVRFRAASGAEHEFDAREAPAQVGAAVEVAYDPALPSNAKVVTRKRQPGCGVVFLAVGVAVILWGSVF